MDLRCKRARAGLLALLTAAALLASGCEKTSTASKGSRPDGGSSATADYPVTVGGVEFSARPQKVAALSPALAELAAELGYGSQLCGRGEECDYPETVKALPCVGSMLMPDIDQIAALDADLVLMQTAPSDRVKSLLDKKGIQVLVIPAASSLDAVAAVYDELGRALGGAHTGAAQAKAAWEAVSGRLSALEQTLAGVEKKTGLYVANADGSVATGDTVMHAVLTAAGLDNAAAQGAGWKLPDGAAAKAAVLLCPASMTGSVGAMAAFKASPAAKNKQIIGVDAIALERQTARMADAAQAIAEKLYPSAFAQTTGDTTAGTDTTAS